MNGASMTTTVSVSSWQKRPAWLAPLVVGLLSTALLLIAERLFQASNALTLPDGYRLHDMTANNTQQTLDVADMNSFGPRSLWYSHVYPPMLDGIRYLLMLPETRAGLPPSGTIVDQRLYFVFAGLFGIVTSVIYLWVRDLTRSGWWALGAAALWAVAPASIMNMTLLEPTPAGIASVTVSFYFLYRFLKTRRLGYASAFFGTLLVASLVRNVVQVHVLVILVIALVVFWFMARRRAAWVQVLNCILVALIFVWPARAFIMYATFDVSSHTGYHRSSALWIDPRTVPEVAYPQHIVDNALAFSSRFNTQETIKDNYRLSAAANDFMLHHPFEAAGRIVQSLEITIPNALTPVTTMTNNYLVDGVSWRGLFEFVSSGWRYVALILLSAAMIVWSRGLRGSLALVRRYGWFALYWVLIAIPVMLSNRYWPPGGEDEGPIHAESARLKSLIDIPVYVLIIYASWLAANRVSKALRPGAGVT
jgi:hypothetical protein